MSQRNGVPSSSALVIGEVDQVDEARASRACTAEGRIPKQREPENFRPTLSRQLVDAYPHQDPRSLGLAPRYSIHNPVSLGSRSSPTLRPAHRRISSLQLAEAHAEAVREAQSSFAASLASSHRHVGAQRQERSGSHSAPACHVQVPGCNTALEQVELPGPFEGVMYAMELAREASQGRILTPEEVGVVFRAAKQLGYDGYESSGEGPPLRQPSAQPLRRRPAGHPSVPGKAHSRKPPPRPPPKPPPRPPPKPSRHSSSPLRHARATMESAAAPKLRRAWQGSSEPALHNSMSSAASIYERERPLTASATRAATSTQYRRPPALESNSSFSRNDDTGLQESSLSRQKHTLAQAALV
jgi:hypothetical protein